MKTDLLNNIFKGFSDNLYSTTEDIAYIIKSLKINDLGEVDDDLETSNKTINGKLKETLDSYALIKAETEQNPLFKEAFNKFILEERNSSLEKSLQRLINDSKIDITTMPNWEAIKKELVKFKNSIDNLSLSSDSGSENDFKSLGKVDSKTILTLFHSGFYAKFALSNNILIRVAKVFKNFNPDNISQEQQFIINALNASHFFKNGIWTNSVDIIGNGVFKSYYNEDEKNLWIDSEIDMPYFYLDYEAITLENNEPTDKKESSDSDKKDDKNGSGREKKGSKTKKHIVTNVEAREKSTLVEAVDAAKPESVEAQKAAIRRREEEIEGLDLNPFDNPNYDENISRFKKITAEIAALNKNVEVGVSPTVNPKDDSTKLNPEKQINIDPNVVSTRNRLFSKISKREYISSGEIYVLNEDGTLKDVGYYDGSRFISSNQEILNLRKKSQEYKDIKKLYDKDLYEYKVFNSTLVHDLKYLIDKVGPEYLKNEIRSLKAIALGTELVASWDVENVNRFLQGIANNHEFDLAIKILGDIKSKVDSANAKSLENKVSNIIESKDSKKDSKVETINPIIPFNEKPVDNNKPNPLKDKNIKKSLSTDSMNTLIEVINDTPIEEINTVLSKLLFISNYTEIENATLYNIKYENGKFTKKIVLLPFDETTDKSKINIIFDKGIIYADNGTITYSNEDSDGNVLFKEVNNIIILGTNINKVIGKHLFTINKISDNEYEVTSTAESVVSKGLERSVKKALINYIKREDIAKTMDILNNREISNKVIYKNEENSVEFTFKNESLEYTEDNNIEQC